MSAIVYRTLSSGTKVPALAFGTGTALYGRDSTRSVLQALETGFVHIDTAQFYRNESSVGDGIAEYLSSHQIPRSSVFITTKFGNKSSGKTLASQLDNAGGRGESISDVLKKQLDELKLDYVDLYLWHTPEGWEGKLGELWKEFEVVKREGLAKEIGISNFRVGDLNELLESIEANEGEVPAVNQIEFHPYVLDTVGPILEIHKKYGITTASYGGQTPVNRVTTGAVTPVLERIVAKWKAEGKDATQGQVLVKWLEARDVIVVTTSSKKSRLQEFLATNELPALTEQEVKEIDEAGRTQHYRGFMQHMDRPRP